MSNAGLDTLDQGRTMPSAARGQHSAPIGGGRLRQVVGSNAFIGFVLALLSWPFNAIALAPTPGTDPSWQATLEMSARFGVPWGTHEISAYGPLGFLTVWSWYYPLLAALSFIFLLGFQSVLFAVVLNRLRRSVPFIPALLLAYVAGTVAFAIVALQYTGIPEKILPLYFIAGVALLSRARETPVPPWMWITLGVTFSLFALVEVGLAIVMFAALVVLVLFSTSERRRAVALIAFGVVPTFVIGWFATGNGFSNLYSFARGSVSEVSGYTSALAIEASGQGGSYWWAALCVGIIVAFAIAHCRGMERRAKVGIGLLTLLFTWSIFKEGFVRHDVYHDPVFFASIPLLLVAFLPSKKNRMWLAAAVAGTTVIAMIVVGSFPSPLGRPDTALDNVGHEFSTLVSPTRTAALIHNAQQAMESGLEVPAPMISTIGALTVTDEPWEEGLIWAYGLHFDQLPASGTGYTTYTDQADAHYLATSDAPRFVVNQLLPSDQNDPTFAGPSTQVALECHYRQVQSEPQSNPYTTWQLLERTRNRCGTPQKITSISAGLGQWIDVPSAPAGDAIVARFNLPLDLWWHLSNFLFKPPSVEVTVNNGASSYQFTPGTASDLHLLVPSQNLQWEPWFAPSSVTSIAFSIGGQGFGTSGVTATFYEIPMSR